MKRAVLGADELEVLEFLAEHRVVITWQLQSLLGVTPRAAEARLRRLVDAGLAGREKIFEGHPEACWITRQGVRAIQSPLSAPKRDLGEYRHDVGLGWLWLAAREGSFGELRGVVSDRMMRSADRRDPAPGRRYGVGAGVGGRLHYPDLLLKTATGHRVAVELELSGKGRRRLDGIMLGYAADPRIDGVLYLCPPGPLGRQVAEAARRAGIADRVSVQLLAPGSPEGAPGPRQSATKSTVRVSSKSTVRSTTRPASRSTTRPAPRSTTLPAPRRPPRAAEL